MRVRKSIVTSVPLNFFFQIKSLIKEKEMNLPRTLI